MSDAFYAAIPPTILALAAFVQAVKNGKSTAIVATKVEEVHKATNGMSQKIADTSRSQGLAEGIIQEKESQAVRDKEKE